MTGYIIIFVEHTVGNTIRKILHHIREEYHSAFHNASKTSPKTTFSISNFILMGQPKKQSTTQKAASVTSGSEITSNNEVDAFAHTFKPVLMEAIQDVLDELETVYDNVSKSAKDHIHSE